MHLLEKGRQEGIKCAKVYNVVLKASMNPFLSSLDPRPACLRDAITASFPTAALLRGSRGDGCLAVSTLQKLCVVRVPATDTSFHLPFVRAAASNNPSSRLFSYAEVLLLQRAPLPVQMIATDERMTEDKLKEIDRLFAQMIQDDGLEPEAHSYGHLIYA